eukprot:TRINITY_DN26974_c0_g1_i1.p1 TRINITY_DN26974_c0_g1~~TRINITY_DN26974_c0_g1_i1.p1  ORF type:complete len:367 (+),score=35.00 TRINITY_DN26974_c0_g1_i1:47-1102(+)
MISKLATMHLFIVFLGYAAYLCNGQRGVFGNYFLNLDNGLSSSFSLDLAGRFMPSGTGTSSSTPVVVIADQGADAAYAEVEVAPAIDSPIVVVPQSPISGSSSPANTPANQDTSCVTVADALSQVDQFSLFLEMLSSAGVLQIFQQRDINGTLFVTRDENFQQVFDRFGLSKESFLQDPFLPRIAAYSILDRKVFLKDFQDEQALVTALPDTQIFVKIDQEEQVYLIPIVSEFTGAIIESDIQLCNIVVHVVSSVMIPAFGRDGLPLAHPGTNVTLPIVPSSSAPLLSNLAEVTQGSQEREGLEIQMPENGDSYGGNGGEIDNQQVQESIDQTSGLEDDDSEGVVTIYIRN